MLVNETIINMQQAMEEQQEEEIHYVEKWNSITAWFHTAAAITQQSKGYEGQIQTTLASHFRL
jgi:hypothetical protein